MRFFVLFAILCFVAVGCTNETVSVPPTTADPQTGTEEGYLAPEFGLLDQNYKDIHLTDYRGKVVLLEFWDSRCTACINDMPLTEHLWDKHRHENFMIIGVSSDLDTNLWRGFISAKGSDDLPRDWTQVHEGGLSVTNLYKTPQVTPFYFLLNRKGVIVKRNLQAVDMETAVTAELAK